MSKQLEEEGLHLMMENIKEFESQHHVFKDDAKLIKLANNIAIKEIKGRIIELDNIRQATDDKKARTQLSFRMLELKTIEQILRKKIK